MEQAGTQWGNFDSGPTAHLASHPWLNVSYIKEPGNERQIDAFILKFLMIWYLIWYLHQENLLSLHGSSVSVYDLLEHIFGEKTIWLEWYSNKSNDLKRFVSIGVSLQKTRITEYKDGT